MWRCSQPLVGVMSNRSAEDEYLFKLIRTSNPHCTTLNIFDARPEINANFNRAAGKGYEIKSHYEKTDLHFMDIENIHKVRETLNGITAAVQRLPSTRRDEEFASLISRSEWYQYIGTILSATNKMVRCLDMDKMSLVCHCSDGWDRTAQLCSLTKLCLEPYYRTIRGYIILIEQDWLSFGHKFHERIGHGKVDSKKQDEMSPVFLQFLDCTYQLLVQFPRHFEFNSQFLVQIAHHLYSCRFGTFLFDCELQRDVNQVSKKTVSLWTYLLNSPAAAAGEFLNGAYSPSGDGAEIEPYGSSWPATSTVSQGLKEAENLESVLASAFKTSEVYSETAKQASQKVAAACGLALATQTSGETSSDSSSAAVSSTTFPSTSIVQLHPGVAVPGLEYPLTRGTVLYPSSSPKRLELWRDYFLRHLTLHEEAPLEHVGLIHQAASTGAHGAVPIPGSDYAPRATTSTMQSTARSGNLMLVQARAALIQSTIVQRALELENQELRAKLELYEKKYGPLPDGSSQPQSTVAFQANSVTSEVPGDTSSHAYRTEGAAPEIESSPEVKPKDAERRKKLLEALVAQLEQEGTPSVHDEELFGDSNTSDPSDSPSSKQSPVVWEDAQVASSDRENSVNQDPGIPLDQEMDEVALDPHAVEEDEDIPQQSTTSSVDDDDKLMAESSDKSTPASVAEESAGLP